MTDMYAQIRKEKLKATPQRVAIYEFLLSTTSHPSVDEIYTAISEEHPSMSLATVYKTLDTFHSAGLVQKLQINQEYARYDGNITPHVHLVCVECDHVFDAKEVLLPEMEGDILNICDFKISTEQHIYFGLCEHCR